MSIITKSEEPFITHKLFSDSVILFVHGFTAGPQSLNWLAKKCADNLKKTDVKSIVLPGHNAYDYATLDKFNAEDWIKKVKDELANLKKQKRYKKVFILGQSMGGALAIIAASQIPVDGVILLNPLANIPAAITLNPLANIAAIALHLSEIFEKFSRFHINSGVNSKEFTYEAFSNKTASELVKISTIAYEQVSNLSSPIGLFLSLKDSVVPYNSREHIISNSNSSILRYFIYEKSDHVLSLSDEKEIVSHDIINLINLIQQTPNEKSIQFNQKTTNLLLDNEFRATIIDQINNMDQYLIGKKPIDRSSRIKKFLGGVPNYNAYSYNLKTVDTLKCFIYLFTSVYGKKKLNHLLKRFNKASNNPKEQLEILSSLDTHYKRLKIRKIQINTENDKSSLEEAEEIVNNILNVRKTQIHAANDTTIKITKKKKGNNVLLQVKSDQSYRSILGQRFEERTTETIDNNTNKITTTSNTQRNVDGINSYRENPQIQKIQSKRFKWIRLIAHKLTYFFHWLIDKINKKLGIKDKKIVATRESTPKNLVSKILFNNVEETIQEEEIEGFLKNTTKAIKKTTSNSILTHTKVEITKIKKHENGIDDTEFIYKIHTYNLLLFFIGGGVNILQALTELYYKVSLNIITRFRNLLLFIRYGVNIYNLLLFTEYGANILQSLTKLPYKMSLNIITRFQNLFRGVKSFFQNHHNEGDLQSDYSDAEDHQPWFEPPQDEIDNNENVIQNDQCTLERNNNNEIIEEENPGSLSNNISNDNSLNQNPLNNDSNNEIINNQNKGKSKVLTWTTLPKISKKKDGETSEAQTSALKTYNNINPNHGRSF